LTPLLYRLGHFCACHPARVLAVWLVVALAIVGVARSVGQETNDDLSPPRTDSQAASDLLGDKFPDQANGSVPIAFRAPTDAKLSDTKYKKPIKQVTKAYGKDPAVTLKILRSLSSSVHSASGAVASSTRSIQSATSLSI
jgi:uncharacterized membrane protein YdfJ with MMPL/SSD domain